MIHNEKRKQKSSKRQGKGIARRLFIYIVLVVLGISGLILISNTLLLKPLYYLSVKNNMVQAISNLSKIDYTADAEAWGEDVNALAAGQTYDVIVRKDTDILYSSSVEFGLHAFTGKSVNGQSGAQGETIAPGDFIPPDNVQTPGQGQGQGQGRNELRRIFFRDPEDLEYVRDGIYYGTASGMSGMDMMVCTAKLSSGIEIMLTQASEPINQSIAQANILLAGCAALALAISLVFVLKISKRFTKPITQIQNTVGSIAALDFSERCKITTGDELQSLGEDVNVLADKLKSSLETLKCQNEQLEKDIILQRQFISNASHELRTPLALIKGYADEMNTGFSEEASQKYIEIIAEESAKMNRLLKEMLELTRMESGTSKIQNENLSISERIQTLLEKYDGFISENRLNISLKLEEGAKGFFDPMRFEQVLANYISNAARYGDEKKQIEIKTETVGDSIRISVFNTGKSIPEEIAGSIWDGFFKADSARTRKEDSYGLGLSIVKAIQNAAGQKFGFRNAPDGVEFWFDVAQSQ